MLRIRYIGLPPPAHKPGTRWYSPARVLWAVAALPVSATVTMSHAHDGGDGGCGGNGGGGGEGHVTTTLPLTQFGLS